MSIDAESKCIDVWSALAVVQVLFDTSILSSLGSLCIGYKSAATSPAYEAGVEQFETALVELSRVRKINVLSVPALTSSTKKILNDVVKHLHEVSGG